MQDIGESQVIYPDPIEYVEYQEENNVLIVASSSNTVSIVQASSGGILCNVDFGDLDQIKLLKAHRFAPICCLGFSDRIIIMSFCGTCLFEYTFEVLGDQVELNSCFWLNDNVSLGLNLKPKDESSMDNSSIWLQVNVGICAKKISPTMPDSNVIH